MDSLFLAHLKMTVLTPQKTMTNYPNLRRKSGMEGKRTHSLAVYMKTDSDVPETGTEDFSGGQLLLVLIDIVTGSLGANTMEDYADLKKGHNADFLSPQQLCRRNSQCRHALFHMPCQHLIF